MSIRTVIEINHDYIGDLKDIDAFMWERLLLNLAGCGFNGEPGERERQFFATRGIRILGQRHHSETLNLKVE